MSRIRIAVVLLTTAVLGCHATPSSSQQQVAGIASLNDLSNWGVTGYVTRAKKGLAISPVPVNTTGLSSTDVLKVGTGSYIVNAEAHCAGCHTGQAGFLAGGVPFFPDHAGHVVWTRNLTSDPATGMQLTESQFIESIRTGKDFHPGATQILIVMPWPALRWSADADLSAVYAYLKAIPAVNNFVPPDNKAGLPLPPEVPFPGVYNEGDVTRPLPTPSPADPLNLRLGWAIQPLQSPDDDALEGNLLAFVRGSYLSNSNAACNNCHSDHERNPMTLNIITASYLSGGLPFTVPPPLQPVIHQTRAMSANLIGQTHGFFHEPGVTFDLFKQIIVTDTHVDDNPPLPLGFPMVLEAQAFANLVDDDLFAIWTYMRLAPPRTGAPDKRTQGTVFWCATSADCGPGQTCTAGPTGNECTGATCSTDFDCGACQTCTNGACAAPLPTSACLAASH